MKYVIIPFCKQKSCPTTVNDNQFTNLDNPYSITHTFSADTYPEAVVLKSRVGLRTHRWLRF